jgi:hypothetical protein
MHMIDDALHEITMAFVLFANAFSESPSTDKVARPQRGSDSVVTI